MTEKSITYLEMIFIAGNENFDGQKSKESPKNTNENTQLYKKKAEFFSDFWKQYFHILQ